MLTKFVNCPSHRSGNDDSFVSSFAMFLQSTLDRKKQKET